MYNSDSTCKFLSNETYIELNIEWLVTPPPFNLKGHWKWLTMNFMNSKTPMTIILLLNIAQQDLYLCLAEYLPLRCFTIQHVKLHIG